MGFFAAKLPRIGAVGASRHHFPHPRTAIHAWGKVEGDGPRPITPRRYLRSHAPGTASERWGVKLFFNTPGPPPGKFLKDANRTRVRPPRPPRVGRRDGVC